MTPQERVRRILVSPRDEWVAIAAESTDVASLYRQYIAILVAIPAICAFVALTIIGAPLIGSFGIAMALRTAVVTYVTGLVSPLVGALVIQRLAPRFKSSGDLVQALKVVAYASTPVWLAGLCYLFVILSPLIVVGVLYAVYLFYLGLPRVMHTPIEHVVPLMVVSAITLIVANIVLRSLVGVFGVPYYGL